MNLDDLSSADRDYIELVHNRLSMLGGLGATNAMPEELGWVESHFPRWKRRSLFPFFLSESVSCELSVRHYLKGKYLVAWFASFQTRDFGAYDSRSLAERGYLLVGTDLFGSYV